MSIFSSNLQYGEFIKNELTTLNYLQKLPSIAKDFSMLYSQAFQRYHYYSGILKKQKADDIKFEFQCEFSLVIEKQNCTVHIQSILEPEYKLSSYMLAFCSDEGDDSKLLRKFHFDYALPVQNQAPKPVYHVQYGGEKIIGSNIDVEPLHPWLSNPRLFYYPINLAILLDNVFFEFKDQNVAANEIVERREWRDLIKRNEVTILTPFYLGVNQFLKNDHKFDFLLRDFYYGK